MRINLVTPFAEKDAAKALGARWDATKKQWYIVDVADLAPFMRWIPHLQAASQETSAVATAKGKAPAPSPSSAAKNPVVTGPRTAVAHCGCAVLPWEHCPHTSAPAA